MIFYTHSLKHLVGLAGFASGGRRDHQENWSGLPEELDPSGYDPAIIRQRAVDSYSACTAGSGSLPLISKQW